MNWLIGVIVIYGLVMLGGGLGAYFSVGSPSSLIVGIASGILLIGSAALAKTHMKLGFGVAAVTTLALCGLFLKRYMDTQRAMNLGLLGLSIVVFGCLVAGHFMNAKAEKRSADSSPN